MGEILLHIAGNRTIAGDTPHGPVVDDDPARALGEGDIGPNGNSISWIAGNSPEAFLDWFPGTVSFKGQPAAESIPGVWGRNEITF